ncbi:WYL domain-containing protein [Oceanisphaera arctica]|uniref:WYL domain-containing protein n=1 Tax=Oceanisphaera arctica TaxID=641510 RepID=A0A2P5TIN1_9GAMM|nr:WYL domain-containing protein [Oceanisphaera arctica]PPL14588.1 WYL domain-containing protein [Oceanisphaera arctica]GHA17774.1 WYL domain-containing protein [Oceanisphaera arctica]
MIKTGRYRRFWLIELISFWEGRLTASHLRQFFGLSRQQASKDINQYLQEQPGNLFYCPSRKGHLPTEQFAPLYISGDVAEYLNWMTGQSAHSMPEAADCWLPHLSLTHPPRNVSPQIIRSLVQALRQQQRVEVDYVAVSRPDRSGRIIVPTAFVNIGRRWHLRAWCERAQGYRDLVLSRFRGEASLEGPPLTPLPADEAWHTELTLLLTPDPRLTPEQQEALALDYGMHNSQLRLTTRAALANYLLQDMQINIKMLDGNPAAQQLILANIDDIKPWLFS